MTMQNLRGCLAAAAFVLVPAFAFSQSSGSAYHAPRTPDGQPDLQGYWNSQTFTPFERPAEFKDKAFFTPEEAAAYQRQRTDQDGFVPPSSREQPISRSAHCLAMILPVAVEPVKQM